MKKLVYVCILEVAINKKILRENKVTCIEKKNCFFELFYQKIVSTSTYIVARFLNYPVYFVIFRNNDNSLREVFNRSNYRFYLK